jgi:putative NIF3 family GTP cyclohydrolase 1 type 2
MRERKEADMEVGTVSLDELAGELDELFSIHDWDRDPAFSRWVPRVYADIGYDYAKTFEDDFCRRHNGLMLRSSDVVREIYCAAFPTPEVLEKLLEQTSGDALLFLHHPLDMEVSGHGFLPIQPAALERLREQGASVYACHAPLDCHDSTGTNASIVEAFDVKVERSFAEYGIGFAGRIGTIRATGLDELVNRGKQIFGVDRVEIGGARPETITRVAIVAGGGDETALFEEAEGSGAQAFITGEWITRTRPPDEQGQAWATANRAACRAYAKTTGMALLAFSHAATEFLVMKGHMTSYFGRKSLPTTCLEQSDWWR